MLQFYIGPSGTGKTHAVLQDIALRASQGQKSLLLVPEQASSNAENTVYRLLGDADSRCVQAVSFTAYAEYILKKHGGAAVQVLTDAGRTVYMRRAIDAVSDRLVCYKRQTRSTHFCVMCADAVKELKIAGADPQQLAAWARELDDDGGRMAELAVIFAAYEALLQGTALDPSDKVTLAAQRLTAEDLADTAVFIDDFSGFTAPEYAMLKKLLAAPQCVVTLCCDELFSQDETDVFAPVRRTAQRLRRLAAAVGAGVASPRQFAEDYRHRSASVLARLHGLYRQNAPAPEARQPDGQFTLTQAQSVYEACRTAAAQIAWTVREQGLSYSQIALVCRDKDKWLGPLQAAFAKYQIPLFADENTTLEHTPAARFFRLALALLRRGVNTADMLQLAKTGLCGISPQNLYQMEHYAFTWRPDAAAWAQPFTQNPAGFTDVFSEDDKQRLAQAEQARGALMRQVQKFADICRGASAQTVCRALFGLLQAFNAEDAVRDMAASLRADGRAALADETLRAWNGVMQLLSELSLLLADQTVTPQELDDLFLLMLRGAEFGRVPQTQDAVIFTTADRMRLDNPAAVFVLGVNEDEFPAAVGYSGLLNHADRAWLNEHEIDMPGAYEARTLLEQFIFYRTLTASQTQLHLLFVAPQVSGAPVSGALDAAVQLLAPPPLRLTAQQLGCTPAAALDYLSEVYRADTPQTAALQAALAQRDDTAAAVQAMRSAAAPQPMHADKGGMAQLLGANLVLSPTRVESFYHCRFSYFLEYGLRIRAPRPAEISPLTGGNLVHYVLEQVLRTAGDGFAQLSAQELHALADDAADAFIAAVMPGAGQRFAYLLARIRANLYTLLEYMQAEQQQSSFHPAAYELPIGLQEGDVTPVTLTDGEGHTVRVVGKIDRVDVMQREGKSYLRVVDYKTGNKKFSLDEVYCGLNMQMLLYLFTLCRNAENRFPQPLASGVLYLLADPAPSSAVRGEAQSTPVYKVDGIVWDDPAVLQGMSRERTTRFLPLTYNKNGTIRNSKMLANMEKLGRIEKHIEQMLVQMAKQLYSGDIAAVPLCGAGQSPCDYCDYRPVCLHEDGIDETQIFAPKNVFETEDAADEP